MDSKRYLAFRFLSAFLAAVIATTQATAHEFDELEIAKIIYLEGFVQVFIDETVKDHEIVCAIYDEAGDLVTSDYWFTSNLVTKITFPIPASAAPPFTARCVFN